MMPRLAGDTLAEKLALNHVIEGDCARWTGAHVPAGYGQISVAGRGVGVHRVAYELSKGPIPEGYEVDHLCRVRDCIRPAHLEAVTHAENVARQLAVITHCPRGHEYTPENSYVRTTARGYPTRMCRTCRRGANRAARKAKRNG